MKRYLILEDGSSFAGQSFGAETISTGELAIQTSNYGYQEALTDPTNNGRILVFTTPVIGTTGINSIDYEAIDPTVRGIICNEIANKISDSPNFQELNYFLKEKKIPAIYGVDTRALAHKLAEHKKLKASIMDANDEHAFDQIRALVLPKNKTAQVSTNNSYAAPNIGKTIVVIDLGLKHSMLRELSLHKANVVVVPYNSNPQDIQNLKPDGIVISNGPGTVNEVYKALTPILDHFYQKLPILAIGLGFLVISSYLNLEIIDLPKPYNGTNYPVIQQNTNVIWQTSVNLNQLVLSENGNLNLSEAYYDLYTDLLAGYYLQDDKILATAFNPEGAPGSFDALPIFDQFINLMELDNATRK
ncbi:carbamoyl phosphate synthase small subunit [Lactobacillus psittaci]|uniref:Carbamoyl-phosphate synthase small chain n=1 Tax=Lactobacillus psittaci DSM 15354 TaxID=1122152 RepID=A0A0R1SB90_9LACO|nr:carbamoyl phosphate synthase small subunit [Lactobacillus psittaci]KRL63621.1 carbamoyl-phosphate synthase small chain [Lactobacillus psittaci DSM 15354]